MRLVLLVLALSSPCSLAYADDVAAQLGTADDGACIVIDETRDTLAPHDRTGAVLLLARQFELAGQRIASGSCAIRYTLAHVELGESIFVTLSGARQTREGMAVGAHTSAAA